MERLKNLGVWFIDETVFWAEVLGEVLGVNRNKYTDLLEKREQEKSRREVLERKQALYQSLNA